MDKNIILPFGLINLNVAITGGLRRLDRLSAAHRIEQEGGNFKTNMSGLVDILVVADELGTRETTKTRKAGQNVLKISESEFYNLIGLY